MRASFWHKAAVAAAGATAAWCAGLLWFASTLPSAVADPATHADAIVVLTGGSGRVEAGLQLLTEGRAERLFVSGVGGRATVEDLLRSGALPQPDLAARIEVGNSAGNTPGNAAETAAWARSRDIRSIRLVTAAYHMPRSLLELRAAMPGVVIIPHPVFPDTVKTDWWRWPGTASLFAREYTKFLATWTLLTFGLGGTMAEFSAESGTQESAAP